MTNAYIEERLHELRREESRITAEVVLLVHEAEKRRLYLERGFPSLIDWLVVVYRYSHSAAQRRIQASRLLEEVPDLARDPGAH